jgi:hypothetical protein
MNRFEPFVAKATIVTTARVCVLRSLFLCFPSVDLHHHHHCHMGDIDGVSIDNVVGSGSRRGSGIRSNSGYSTATVGGGVTNGTSASSTPIPIPPSFTTITIQPALITIPTATATDGGNTMVAQTTTNASNAVNVVAAATPLPSSNDHAVLVRPTSIKVAPATGSIATVVASSLTSAHVSSPLHNNNHHMMNGLVNGGNGNSSSSNGATAQHTLSHHPSSYTRALYGSSTSMLACSCSARCHAWIVNFAARLGFAHWKPQHQAQTIGVGYIGGESLDHTLLVLRAQILLTIWLISFPVCVLLLIVSYAIGFVYMGAAMIICFLFSASTPFLMRFTHGVRAASYSLVITLPLPIC